MLSEATNFWSGFSNPFFLTICFIFLSTIVAAFIKGRNRDKCLKAFNGYMVTLEDSAGKHVWGNLRVEPTGMELIYEKSNLDTDGHVESSYMIYKYEYGNIAAIVRFHEYLTAKHNSKREKELKRAYHPSGIRKLFRKIGNIFKTIRDTVMEVSNVLISQGKKTTVAGGLLSSQEKYVSQMKNEIIGSVDTAYEPLLERYIGRKVVAEFVYKDKPVELVGILKDYTADFVELLDVQYWADQPDEFKKADILLPRKRAVIRHLAE